MSGIFLIDRFFTGQHFSGLVKFIIPVIWLPIGVFLNSIDSEYLVLFIVTSIVLYALWIFVDGISINDRVKRYNLKRVIGNL